MVKTFCDYCGNEITCADFQVTAEFSACGYDGDVDYVESSEFHYHSDCAKEVRKTLERMQRAAAMREGSRCRE